MDKYTVKMFPQAYHDLDKIYEHALANSNYNNNALNLAQRLEATILSLAEQPHRGAERKYGFYAYKGYRQLFISGYIIIYEVLDVEKIVAILTIKYSGNDF